MTNGAHTREAVAAERRESRALRAHRTVNRARSVARRLPRRWDRRARDLGKVVLNYRGARRSIVRQGLFAVLGRTSELLLVPFGEGRLLVPTQDREVGRVVFVRGEYERIYMTAAIAEMVRLGLVPAGKTFVDIGANIGTSTVDALLHFGFSRALCFEPDERSFRVLLANLALNGLAGRATGYQMALSDVDGDAVLALSNTNLADNRLVPGDEPGPSAEPRVRVQRQRFDTLIADGAVDLAEIGLIWIDVQGHEPSVLAGATSAIEAGIPLVIEYTPTALRASGRLAELEQAIRDNYTTVVDLHLLAEGIRSTAVLDADRMYDLALPQTDWEHTDLLIVRLGNRSA